jgi:hypothetical protein
MVLMHFISNGPFNFPNWNALRSSMPAEPYRIESMILFRVSSRSLKRPVRLRSSRWPVSIARDDYEWGPFKKQQGCKLAMTYDF